MRNGRMTTRWRTALLTMVAVLGLGACGEDATRGEGLIGTWEARMEMSGAFREVHRLEITPTAYTWTQEIYSPNGRPDDGLELRLTRSGDWQVRGDRLAVRAESMQQWTHPSGEAIIIDFAVTWDETNRISGLQGDRMTITHVPPPEMSYMRPTLHFQRVR